MVRAVCETATTDGDKRAHDSGLNAELSNGERCESQVAKPDDLTTSISHEGERPILTVRATHRCHDRAQPYGNHPVGRKRDNRVNFPVDDLHNMWKSGANVGPDVVSHRTSRCTGCWSIGADAELFRSLVGPAR